MTETECPYHHRRWRGQLQCLLNGLRGNVLQERHIMRFPTAVCVCTGKRSLIHRNVLVSICIASSPIADESLGTRLCHAWCTDGALMHTFSCRQRSFLPWQSAKQSCRDEGVVWFAGEWWCRPETCPTDHRPFHCVSQWRVTWPGDQRGDYGGAVSGQRCLQWWVNLQHVSPGFNPLYPDFQAQPNWNEEIL